MTKPGLVTPPVHQPSAACAAVEVQTNSANLAQPTTTMLYTVTESSMESDLVSAQGSTPRGKSSRKKKKKNLGRRKARNTNQAQNQELAK
jgi:hypothetical protein